MTMLKTEYYYRNPRGIYRSRLVNYLGFWVLALDFFLVVITLVHALLNVDFIASIHAAALLVSLAVTVVWLVIQVVNVFKFKGVRNYMHARVIAHSIRRSLLNTMNLNVSREAPQRVQVPGVAVRLAPLPITITIDKLAGMHDIEGLIEDVNSSLRGHYCNYAVTSAIVEDDGLHYILSIEDVGTDRTFRPKTIEDLIQKPYFFKLQEGLTVNISKNPGIAVWGATSSGKSTVLFSLIAQALSNNSQLFFIDGKQEFSSLSVFYPADRIASDNETVLALLERVTKLMEKRQEIVAEEVKKRKKLGLTGYDIGLTPIILIADEVGSVVASMDSKQKRKFIAYMTQIAQKSRSTSGPYLLLSSQSPGTDVLPSGVRSQLSTRILLSSASGDVQRMAFNGMTATDGDVERFKGYYISNGRTVQPMKFSVPDLFTHNLNNLETFEQLYNYGRNHG